MGERDGEVGFFWAMADNSNSGASSEDKSTVVNKLPDDHSPINQPHDIGSGDIQPVDDHAAHLWTERQRRKKMRTMFHDLHALLPQLPPKAEMSTIVDEAISYITTLQETLKDLEIQKLKRLNNRESFLADHGSITTCTHFDIISRPFSKIFPAVWCSPIVFRTWTSSNITLNVCGPDAHISICSSRKRGLLTAICVVLEKHNLEIVSAHISSDRYKSMFMIHVRVNVGDELMKIFPYDEVYKLAALEIMLWVNS
ncbi:transcription factor bHLH95-like [Cynara cardunculus var. scolymus]|uniref:transcription factor bHLH95-like n=1 Tax=Cynara cardunculus var. scolymus TaxID=59895 RepID=UPI000D62FE7F|nr:transcription factor bHLH95-like [Cynara cardunculus var. scolymus]